MRKNAGFLLIEVVVVIALVIIIVTLAMPQMSFLNKQIIRSEIEKLASVCLFLRQSALVTHRDQTLVFNQMHSSYSSEQASYTLASGVKFGFLHNSYGPPSNPSNLINQAVTFKREKIVFYADGTISSGTIYLIDATQNYFYALTTPSGQLPCIRKYEYQHSGQRWALVS
jgi:Tfp pilus assembly protein FimT